jgi:hypothetical protein
MKPDWKIDSMICTDELMRMISRVCGRTNLILQSRSTSALPEVSAPVTTNQMASTR